MSKWTEFSISKHLQTTKPIKKHLFFRTQKFYILKLLNLFGSKQPPDLNPIEHKWAQAKSKRRKYQCGIDELFKEHCL
ncbi:hypothetical protein [Candidatus Neptunichlamydia sp. REUL1]|uniref:hypothetical protein n=1 Tax=Candidatus Neptunichlamydia sp. REUL1 TaxID=3064277 RepID=UPI00293073B5|nr:hypothetical protein [Candidatus Neptunochlamydia sp. REUL1]